MTAIIIIAVIAILVIYVISAYNSFAAMKTKIDEAFSTMDVYFKKRYDLIPNLVETVKGYTKHESETLENVVRARNSAISATGEAKAESEKELTGALTHLFALSESYPQLKADTQFINLQNQLTGIEGELAQSRKYYNAVVRTYNQKCVTIPSSIVASIFHFEQKPYFTVDSSEERQNVKVKF
ncbi:MAG: LemA family protein [Clostridia bacterium]